MRTRLWVLVGATAVIPLLALAVWFALHPLQYKELTERFDLYRRGVRTVAGAPYEILAYNTCPTAASTPGACVCLLFLHGAADTGLTWRKVLTGPRSSANIKEGWSVPTHAWAPSLPHGTPRALAEGLSLIMRTDKGAPCRKWNVIGNSRGGWVAAWLALDHPELVSKLMLVDSAGLKAHERDEILLRDPSPEAVQDFMNRAYAKDREIPRRILEAVVDRIHEEIEYRRNQPPTEPEYLDGKLGSIKVPTLVFWGEEDLVIPLAAGKALASQIPGAVLRSVPECGHLPHKECPDAFLKALAELVHLGSY